MTTAKPPKEKSERVNIMMPLPVQEIADKLMQGRLKGDKFSEFLRDLIIEEYNRPAAATKAELEWLNRAFREALAETIKLKEEILKLQAKIDSLKRDVRTGDEALALCEADLKQARSQKP
jgi:hypothetical protein